MRILPILLLSSVSALSAVVTQNGGSNFKSTKQSAARQTVVFSQMTNQSSLTLACWVKYNWTDAGVNSQLGAGAKQGLVSKGRFETAGGDGFQQLGLSSVSEKIGFSFSNPNGTYHIWRTTGNSVQTNKWMHLACSFTYSNANSLILYIDGTNAIGSWTAGTGNAVGQTNATGLNTFLYAQNGASSFFGGAMAELALWTNTLSTAEIVKLAKSRIKYMPLQIQPASLMLYYPMDTWPAIAGTPATSNSDKDRTQTQFHMDAGGTFYGERVCSYQPNE